MWTCMCVHVCMCVFISFEKELFTTSVISLSGTPVYFTGLSISFSKFNNNFLNL